MGAVSEGPDKECSRCGETKPIEAFQRRSGRERHRHMSFCLPCLQEYRREAYARVRGRRRPGEPLVREQFTREEKARWSKNLDALIERVTGRKPARGRKGRAWVLHGSRAHTLKITAGIGE